MERDLQEIEQDINATYYPNPELFYAIDSLVNMTLILDGSRFELAYRIYITTLNPFDVKEYHVSAISGSIIKKHNVLCNNGPADVFGYGTQTIDTQWKGGFTNAWVLNTNDNTRNVHTKRCTGNNCNTWTGTSEVTSNNNNWVGSNIEHTSAHYNVSSARDYFKTEFNRLGMDDEGSIVRVKSKHPEEMFDAYYNPLSGGKGMITFPKIPNTQNTMGMDPVIAAHEFTHGVIQHTASLINSGESGSLAESFCDIFGVMCKAKLYDNNTTNWIVGDMFNNNPHMRDMSNPNDSVDPQPDTYQGLFWSMNVEDIHRNNGVNNHWFFLLSQGGWGINDLFDNFNVNGIGMQKASIIAYYSLKLILQSSSQYSDAREATITFAAALYGECSLEHQATINAWHAVGLGPQHGCSFTLNLISNNQLEVLVSPNPATNIINILLPKTSVAISLFDISGKKLSSYSASELSTSIDIEHLQSGVYLMSFDFGDQIITKRFIKE